MKIAVTSQNARTITGHAGKCCQFWIYEIECDEVRDKRLLVIPFAQSFHASNDYARHPLDEVKILITGGMGQDLQRRLWRKGTLAVVTRETEPDRAVELLLAGELETLAPETLHLDGSCDLQQAPFCLAADSSNASAALRRTDGCDEFF